MNNKHQYPDEFQAQALQMLHSLLPISSSAFYLVDPDMRERGVALHNLKDEVEQQYQQRFKSLDPLNPDNFRRSNIALAVLDEQINITDLEHSTYYQEFMRPHQHRHVVDLFFRQSQEIIAVATLLRSAELGPFKTEEIKLLKNLQPFLQFTLNQLYQPKRFNQRQQIQEKYQLTQREAEVLDLIIGGHSNKLIARDLQLGLATVKTHLLHIFQKTQVNSRTELLALIIHDLQNH